MTHDISVVPSGLRFLAGADETLLSAAIRQGIGRLGDNIQQLFRVQSPVKTPLTH
jgi:hypothetical protein